MPVSPKRGYNYPAQGTKPYFDEIEETILDIDSDVDDVAKQVTTTYNTIGTASAPGELRQNEGTVTTIAHVKGFWDANDGGGGIFNWIVGSATDNGGTIIVPQGTPSGYWKRLYEGHVLNAKWFGARSANPDNGLYINSILTSIGTDKTTIYIPQDPEVTTTTYDFTTDVTAPANVTLAIEHGAILDIASSKSLTINGPLEADPVQIFSGSGSVVIGENVIEAIIDWWGPPRTSGSDDAPALQAAHDSGALIVRALSGCYYFSSPVELNINGFTLVGTTMLGGPAGTDGTVFYGNSGFAVGSADAEAILWLNDGRDYITIERLRFDLQSNVDYAIYALGDTSHQTIVIRDVSIVDAVQWGVRVSCYLGTFERVRVADSNGIWIGKHDASSTESTNVNLSGCYVVQSSASKTTTAYRLSSINSFNALACAGDFNQYYFYIDTSIGVISGCDGEFNRIPIYTDNAVSNVRVQGCRLYRCGDDSGTPDPVAHIIRFEGRLSITDSAINLVTGGVGDTFTKFIVENTASDELALGNLRVYDPTDRDPYNDGNNMPNDTVIQCAHNIPYLNSSGVVTLSVDQSIASGSPGVIISFDTVVFDLRGNFITPPNWFIFSQAQGVYRFKAHVTLEDVAASKTVILYLYTLTGPTLLATERVTTSVAGDVTISLDKVFQVTNSRSYYVRVEHDHGSNRFVKAGEDKSYFELQRIGPYK